MNIRFILIFMFVTSIAYTQREFIESRRYDTKLTQQTGRDSFWIEYPGNWLNADSVVIYTTSAGGYVFGTNGFDDLSKGQHFIVDTAYYIHGAYFWIGELTGDVGLVHFDIWDFETEPMDLIYRKSVSVNELQTVFNPSDMVYIEFGEPIKVEKDYVMGIDVSDISTSEIGLVSTRHEDGGLLDLVWEQWNDFSWHSVLDSWNLDVDLAIFPRVSYGEIIDDNGDFAGGNGTLENPYLIANADQLNKVRKYLNAHFLIINDIHLDSMPWNTSFGWLPIGTIGHPFRGSLQGQNHTIHDLYINRRGIDFQGLFGALDQATVSDLNISHGIITGNHYVGAIAGSIRNSELSNINISGEIEGNLYVGGLCGIAEESGINSIHIAGKVSGSYYTGGLAGQITSSTTIEQSSTMGSVEATKIAGGLVGMIGENAPLPISGPGGVTIVVPGENRADASMITMEASEASFVLRDEEILASPVIKINVAGNLDLVSGAPVEDEVFPVFTTTFPITLENAEAERLRVRVYMRDDTRLPVFGTYDPDAKTYTIHTFGFGDEWILGVVSGSKVTPIGNKSDGQHAQRADKSWKTLDFWIYDDSERTSTTTDTISREDIEEYIRPIARDVLINYHSMNYKSPQLYRISNDLNAFKLHLIDTDQPDHPAVSQSSYYYPPDRYNKLGGIYIFYKDYYIPDRMDPSTWKLKYVISHEIFHAIQNAYGFRVDNIQSAYFNGPGRTSMGVEEGTATLVGGTYEAIGALGPGNVHIHLNENKNNLSGSFDDVNRDPYSTQDFYAFISKRYFQGGLAFMGPLWQEISDYWPVVNYTRLIEFYRKGFDKFLKKSGYSLPWVYTEYAFQRLIIHDSEYLLWPDEMDGSNDEFKKFNVAKSLLDANKYILRESSSNTTLELGNASISNIKYLTSAAVQFAIPDVLDPELKPDSLEFIVKIRGGGTVQPDLDKEGIRIAVYRRNKNGLADGEASFLLRPDQDTIKLSLFDTDTISFVIINAYIEEVTVGVDITLKKDGQVHNATQNKWYTTIQGCVLEAVSGDEIIVYPGTYNEMVDVRDKNLRITSAEGADSTIIDGTGLSSTGVLIARCNNCEFSGFTVTNWSRRALYVSNSDILIKDNKIINNHNNESLGLRGDIFDVTSSKSIISNNLIANNSTYDFDNPGLVIWDGEFQIINNTVENNKGPYEWMRGGGIAIYEEVQGIISNNTISKNEAGYSGGGIYVYSNQVIIQNNVIKDNTAYEGGGIFLEVQKRSQPSNFTVTGNQILNNKANFEGGGILIQDNTAMVTNNTVSGNSAQGGGGCYIHALSEANSLKPTLSGNSFTSNWADNRGGGVSGPFHGIQWLENITINDQNTQTPAHIGPWTDGHNFYSGNNHGDSFDCYGPGVDNTAIDCGKNVYLHSWFY